MRDYRLGGARQSAQELHALARDLQKVADLYGHCSYGRMIEVHLAIVRAIRDLCEWAAETMEAAPNAHRFLQAAKTEAAAASELLEDLAHTEYPTGARRAIDRIGAVQEPVDIHSALISVAGIPTPVPALVGELRRTSSLSDMPGDGTVDLSVPFVIKVMLSIDGSPWSTPHVIQAGLIYDLDAHITVPRWPERCARLVLDYTSTMHPSDYALTELEVERPDGDVAEFVKSGTIRFARPQSLLSAPHTIRVIGRFLDGDDEPIEDATIVGYHQLRVKVVAAERAQTLCGYRLLDQRIADLAHKIDSEVKQLDPVHREDFLAALSAVVNFAGSCAQEARYMERMQIRESDFRRDLVRHLRRSYGEEVTEGEEAGGGPTDIKYRTVTIEVKVERELKSRDKIVQKYVSQPVQYSSGGGAQLGILCVLDTSQKYLPSAAPQNQIQLVAPPVHGFEGKEPPYPSYIAVVFVDGNLRKPSSFSR